MIAARELHTDAEEIYKHVLRAELMGEAIDHVAATDLLRRAEQIADRVRTAIWKHERLHTEIRIRKGASE